MITQEQTTNLSDSVRNTRAGDVFHYRWAARRCLRMLDFKSLVRLIVVEGSKDASSPGEFVMDVTEYRESETDSTKQSINYFQLKHSTVRVTEPFQLSELQSTFKGFAERFKYHQTDPNSKYESYKFYLITNRPLNPKIANTINSVVSNFKPDKRTLSTLKSYTGLSEADFHKFCSELEIIDSEVGFQSQKSELHFEMGALFAGALENSEINNLISLIQEKALPEKNKSSQGHITREDVLKQFGVTDPSELLPAAAALEKINVQIPLKQHTELLAEILESSTPIVLLAEGGVGKTIACQTLSRMLPLGSISIIYDCFGAGNYLNKSQPRHRYRDALIQISNEIALQGYCSTLIPRSNDQDDSLLRSFISRINTSAQKLEIENEKAILAIFIDAADNSAMAAQEALDTCFVHGLIGQNWPKNCRFIFTSRPERFEYLNAKSTNKILNLEPFTESESCSHLRTVFADANDYTGKEFHRLTNGNPRVQANALSIPSTRVEDILTGLGPGMTVNQQISLQLQNAISRLKDIHSQLYQADIDAICFGLANLPPYIPLEVLAAASDVSESAIKGFISDIGRPLWFTGSHIQFRDEPTEYWFRNTFAANVEQVSAYVSRVKPLSQTFNYVAEILPLLMIKAGMYEQTIELALSGDLLPDSPIDKRNVKLNRLQFAFKAALKQKKYADAIKLAILAGEENAGDERQFDLLSKNVDLIALLQSPQRVQELAFRREIAGEWTGSENVYSASLLSTVEDFKGEAQGYLRAANNWLDLYLQERRGLEKFDPYKNKLKNEEISELAFTVLNLFGPQKLVEFVNQWQPKIAAFSISKNLAKRLVDTASFDKLSEISSQSPCNVYMLLAINHELWRVGKHIAPKELLHTVTCLGSAKQRPKLDSDGIRRIGIDDAVVALCEACAFNKIPLNKTLKVLDFYFPQRAEAFIHGQYGHEHERRVFLNASALRAILISGKNEFPLLDLESLMPEIWLSENEMTYEQKQDKEKFCQIIGCLLSWHLGRAITICHPDLEIDPLLRCVKASARKYASEHNHSTSYLSAEIANVHFGFFVYSNSAHQAIDLLKAELTSGKSDFSIDDSFEALRVAIRHPKLNQLIEPLLGICHEITQNKNVESDIRGERYIDLARTVMPYALEDAKGYFDCAIDAVSKFGNELVPRWEALVALAERASQSSFKEADLAYRFIRCAELVGDNVSREKHWDRDGAIGTCFKLHPAMAFASLSRWRDREIGYFERQLTTLLDEVLISKTIPPRACWALSCLAQNAYIDHYGYLEHSEKCIEMEIDSNIRQYIFDQTCRDFLLRSNNKISIEKLVKIGEKYKINFDTIKNTVQDHTPENTSIEKKSLDHDVNYFSDWNGLFGGLDLTDLSTINIVVGKFKKLKEPKNIDDFWAQFFNYYPVSNAKEILSSLINTEDVDHFDIVEIFSTLPTTWRNRISVQKIWGDLLTAVGKRYCYDFIKWYYSKLFIQRTKASDTEKDFLFAGVMAGLESSVIQDDSYTYFSFCGIANTYITPEVAAELLKFGLARFEIHIDSEFGDGDWSESLNPPTEPSDYVSGLLWSALGSPRSQTRWKSAHALRRLIETNSVDLIDGVYRWLSVDKVDCFGHANYPFYNLHSRLFALIGSARAAKNNPASLLKFKNFFEEHALTNLPHSSIQNFSADIALSLEKFSPGTYAEPVLNQLKSLNTSPFDELKREDYKSIFKTPWHQSGEIRDLTKITFSYDFDRYWFEPLGEIFGVSANQVEDLCAKFVTEELNVELKDSHIVDPRRSLWRNDNRNETFHSHSDVPRTDDYQFYISYHALLNVAAKLHKAMPIVIRYDYEVENWREWLRKYTLTCPSGYWLSDIRDPSPITKRDWIGKPKSNDWKWEIASTDFLELLLKEEKGHLWLNVDGHWSAVDDGIYTEDCSISSAFVQPSTSSSLLMALSTCSNPHDFKLPDYLEDRMEFSFNDFVLKGWIERIDIGKYLDDLDPKSADIPYPPFTIGNSIAEQFNLIQSDDQKQWVVKGEEEPSLVSEIWADEKSYYRDYEVARGIRFKTKLSFLQKICTELNKHLIIEVQIKRRKARESYNQKGRDEIEYTPSYSKIYLLNSDGELRDTTTCYRLRKETS